MTQGTAKGIHVLCLECTVVSIAYLVHPRMFVPGMFTHLRDIEALPLLGDDFQSGALLMACVGCFTRSGDFSISLAAVA